MNTTHNVTDGLNHLSLLNNVNLIVEAFVKGGLKGLS